jgi:hypothetical protein
VEIVSVLRKRKRDQKSMTSFSFFLSLLLHSKTDRNDKENRTEITIE